MEHQFVSFMISEQSFTFVSVATPIKHLQEVITFFVTGHRHRAISLVKNSQPSVCYALQVKLLTAIEKTPSPLQLDDDVVRWYMLADRPVAVCAKKMVTRLKRWH